MCYIVDSRLPTVKLSLEGQKESRKILYLKTREALKYIYHNFYQKADWFLKTDDDT